MNIFKNKNSEIIPDKEKIFIYKFYIDLFNSVNTDANKMLDKHFILAKKLLNLSNDFTIKSKEEKVNSIFFRNVQLDLSAENYLFLKFMKFHSGFLKFNELYSQVENIEIDENILNEFISRQFFVCLEKSKRNLKDKVKDFSDFQIISNICVKERLMFFNYLTDKGTQRKMARDFINSEYMKVFRGQAKVPSLNETKKINLNE